MPDSAYILCPVNIIPRVTKQTKIVRLKLVLVCEGSQKTCIPLVFTRKIMDQQSINPNNRSQAHKRNNFNRSQKKKPPPKISRRQNDIYITTKSNFKAQQKHCEDLLNSGIKEIYLHCLGNAIIRGLNLALTLVNNSNDALAYAINTSTVNLVDEYHPLCDEDDISIQRRNNSAVHIKISRNSVYDVDVAFSN